MSQSRFTQFSIVHRIFLGFAVLSLLIAIGGGATILLAKQISSSFRALTDNSQVTQNLAAELGTSALRTGIEILDMDRTLSLEQLQKEQQEVAQSSAQLDALIAQMQQHANRFGLSTVNRNLGSAGDIVQQLGRHADELASNQATFISNDEAVRAGLTRFLLQSSDLKKRINQLSAEPAQYDSYIKDILDIVMERFSLIEFLLSNMVNTKDTDDVVTIVGRIQQSTEVYNEYMDSLFVEVPELDTPAIRAEVKQFNDQISASNGIVTNYLNNQQTIAEIDNITRQILSELTELDQVVSEITAAAAQSSEQASARSQQQIEFTVSAVTVVVPIGLLFAIALAFWLAGLIRKPLSHTQTQMQQLEKGDFSATMQGRYQGEFAQLVRSINSLIEQMRGVFQQMQTAAAKLTSVSDKNNHTAAQVQTKLQQQTAELSSVATAVTEMESAIKEVAASVDSSRDLSHSIEQHIDDGQAVMDQNISMIESLNSTLQQNSKQVDNLNEASKQIGSVIGVIEGIAEKTNLLALNAAIEAARAGDQGRGFAVVADEVRTLAAQTAKSTESVRSMVTTIRNESHQVFEAMAKSREQMSESKELVSKSSEAMHTIRDNMGEMRSMSDHISVAAQQQHHVASEVTRNVNVIASVAEDNFALIESVARSSDELSEQVGAIEAMLNRFVLR
ncbi:methyl-accepting chemotaxis protein [Aliagarivorans marinus]|uniref:methyl-accepting chemotaxis protein n=1 Tax=Aliagarivorans marinus TaxID=561965 RepID=UPI00041C1974|nr:HAMP domain-containing methyl-accepting chemotaxis protein [Aliagarivorans marinus]